MYFSRSTRHHDTGQELWHVTQLAGRRSSWMPKRKAQEIDWGREPCPLCSKATLPREDKIQWIACESKDCGKWFHCSCLGTTPTALAFFYCEECTAVGRGRTKYREERPKRSKAGVDYTALDAGEHVNAFRHAYTSMIEARSFAPPAVTVVDGRDLRKEYLDKHGFTQPIVVRSPEGLDMSIPSDLTVSQVGNLLGPETPLEVMDVPTQGEDKGWTLGKWTEYYNGSAIERVRNVISLEVTDTALGAKILRPKVVRELDLLHNYWPKRKSPERDMPKVQTYCLMSLQNSYTDFHIDFAGTSVYYHIISGSKTFLFIPPTSANFNKYSDWCKSPDQSKTFLADLCKETFKVELTKGDTMFIPSGWIHAVHTPSRSLVIGGNFLHLHGMCNHIRVTSIEISTKVPGKFRFPHFKTTLWYTGIGILARRLRPSMKELPGALALAQYLLEDAKVHGGKKKSDSIPLRHICGSPKMVAEYLLDFLGGRASSIDTIRNTSHSNVMLRVDIPVEEYVALCARQASRPETTPPMTTIEDETFMTVWLEVQSAPDSAPFLCYNMMSSQKKVTEKGEFSKTLDAEAQAPSLLHTQSTRHDKELRIAELDPKIEISDNQDGSAGLPPLPSYNEEPIKQEVSTHQDILIAQSTPAYGFHPTEQNTSTQQNMSLIPSIRAQQHAESAQEKIPIMKDNVMTNGVVEPSFNTGIDTMKNNYLPPLMNLSPISQESRQQSAARQQSFALQQQQQRWATVEATTHGPTQLDQPAEPIAQHALISTTESAAQSSAGSIHSDSECPKPSEGPACYRCRGKKRRCDRGRPCRSCSHAGIPDACATHQDGSADYGQDSITQDCTQAAHDQVYSQNYDCSSANRPAYANSPSFTGVNPSFASVDFNEYSATPANLFEAHPAFQDTTENMFEIYPSVKPNKSVEEEARKHFRMESNGISSKLYKSRPRQRKGNMRCTRCARDKKTCDRAEPICDRCIKKGLQPNDCNYPGTNIASEVGVALQPKRHTVIPAILTGTSEPQERYENVVSQMFMKPAISTNEPAKALDAAINAS